MNMQNNAIKNQDELNFIIHASKIIDDAYDFVLSKIELGMTEIAVADMIEEFVLSQGAESLSFDTIVAFGKNGAEPHHIPTCDKLSKGDFVTIDMGAIYNGYCSDFTRTFAVGSISEKQKLVYEIVKESQRLGMLEVGNDVKCFDVDKTCRDYISKQGFGDFFIHGTGHGVGKQIHEAPILNTRSEDILKNNMVVTVEPGIYIENELGVRIEDMIIVGNSQSVSRHGTELIIIDKK